MESSAEKVFFQIRKNLSKSLKIKESEIELSSTLKDDLGIDSADGIDMVFMIEEQFSIKVSDRDLKDVHSIQGLVTLIESKLGK